MKDEEGGGEEEEEKDGEGGGGGTIDLDYAHSISPSERESVGPNGPIRPPLARGKTSPRSSRSTVQKRCETRQSQRSCVQNCKVLNASVHAHATERSRNDLRNTSAHSE